MGGVHTTEHLRLRRYPVDLEPQQADCKPFLAVKRFGGVLPRRKSEISPVYSLLSFHIRTLFRQDMSQPTQVLSAEKSFEDHECSGEFQIYPGLSETPSNLKGG